MHICTLRESLSSFRLRLQVECNIAFDLGVYETVDDEPDQTGPAVTSLPEKVHRFDRTIPEPCAAF